MAKIVINIDRHRHYWLMPWGNAREGSNDIAVEVDEEFRQGVIKALSQWTNVQEELGRLYVAGRAEKEAAQRAKAAVVRAEGMAWEAARREAARAAKKEPE